MIEAEMSLQKAESLIHQNLGHRPKRLSVLLIQAVSLILLLFVSGLQSEIYILPNYKGRYPLLWCYRLSAL